ncbi:MAG: hypothetical protein F6J93_00990 [Oscillatoria sp. SIO1A7]|nr:hypothetical protein [Oscillatoria sp. SIO1A7]
MPAPRAPHTTGAILLTETLRERAIASLPPLNRCKGIAPTGFMGNQPDLILPTVGQASRLSYGRFFFERLNEFDINIKSGYITHKSRRGGAPVPAPEAPGAAGAGTGAPPLQTVTV